ncbi:MAG: inositol monophosphatase family protein [Proteobacteria bacterium]|nr:inositol monophosphatase family protein [Pseudomonadota bacterium]
MVDGRIIEKILRGCGALLLENLAKGRIEGEWYGDQFKAVADMIAHDFITSSLAKEFPGVPVVSEEDFESIGVCLDDHFLVDPIDGTASYVSGFPGWVTQIAFVKDNKPKLVGIYAPASDEYFSAASSNGAFCNGSRLTVEGAGERPESLIDNYPEARGAASELMNALGIQRYIESGSIALKICRIADRGADVFIKDMSPRDWDVAAPMLVLEEAGGVLTDIHGEPLVIGRAERRHHGLIAAANVPVSKKVCSWFVR